MQNTYVNRNHENSKHNSQNIYSFEAYTRFVGGSKELNSYGNTLWDQTIDELFVLYSQLHLQRCFPADFPEIHSRVHHEKKRR